MSDRGHVFIVDDDTRSADTLTKLLENNGYLVLSRNTGDRSPCPRSRGACFTVRLPREQSQAVH